MQEIGGEVFTLDWKCLLKASRHDAQVFLVRIQVLNPDSFTEVEEIKSYYENLLDYIPGHLFWKDKEGRFLGSNQQQAETVGLDRKKLIGKAFIGLDSAEGAVNKIKQNNKYVIENDTTIVTQEPGFDANKNIVTYLSKKAPLKNKQGEIIGTVGVSIDINDLIEREKQLAQDKKEAEFSLSYIIANLPYHVYWKDREGRFLGCNESQAKAAGFTREEMIGKTTKDCPWYESFEEIRADELKAMKLGAAVTSKKIGLKEKGEKAYYLTTRLPLKNSQDEIIGTMGISVDISAERKAEQLERENVVIKQTAESARILAASIAHEMRTPFASVNMRTASLKRMIPELVTAVEKVITENPNDQATLPLALREKNLDSLCSIPQEIEDTVAQANHFIDMLLQNVHQIANVDLSHLSIVEAVEKALAAYPFHDSAPVKVSYDNSVDFIFNGSQELFSPILFNLLKNAIFYILQVGKGDISIWSELGEKHNTLHFKDTGAGIKKAYLPKIFDHFFSQTRHGSGVGLAYCKMAMQSVGGKITCESEEGEYTHFKLCFLKPGTLGEDVS
jgi:PAS domain S-box-containing protein